jgi:hypothetical protein
MANWAEFPASDPRMADSPRRRGASARPTARFACGIATHGE